MCSNQLHNLFRICFKMTLNSEIVIYIVGINILFLWMSFQSQIWIFFRISEAWIGLSDKLNNYFVWANGDPFEIGTYTGLGSTPIYDCIMASSSGQFDSARCHESKHYICEYTLNGELFDELALCNLTEILIDDYYKTRWRWLKIEKKIKTFLYFK